MSTEKKSPLPGDHKEACSPDLSLNRRAMFKAALVAAGSTSVFFPSVRAFGAFGGLSLGPTLVLGFGFFEHADGVTVSAPLEAACFVGGDSGASQLEGADIIQKLDGQTVNSVTDLKNIIGLLNFELGDTIDVEVGRFGSGTVAAQITLKILDLACLANHPEPVPDQDKCEAQTKKNKNGTVTVEQLLCTTGQTDCETCDVKPRYVKRENIKGTKAHFDHYVQKCKLTPAACQTSVPDDHHYKVIGLS